MEDTIKKPIKPEREESEWDRAFFDLATVPIDESSLKTPSMVQWLIGICVVLFAILFFLGQVLPSNKAGLYLLVSSVSILLIGAFGLFALAKSANQSRNLKELLDIDRTTGLFSSFLLYEKLDRLIALGKNSISIVFIDLDELKEYNDKFGHRRGDRLLRNAADIMNTALSGKGVGFRYGGDEFVAILKDIDYESAIEIATRIHRYFIKGGISASLGICEWCPNMTSDELLHEADLAMYKAKRSGKGRLFVPKNKTAGGSGELSGNIIH